MPLKRNEIQIALEILFTLRSKVSFGSSDRGSLTSEYHGRMWKCRVGKAAQPPEQPVVSDAFILFDEKASNDDPITLAAALVQNPACSQAGERQVSVKTERASMCRQRILALRGRRGMGWRPFR